MILHTKKKSRSFRNSKYLFDSTMPLIFPDNFNDSKIQKHNAKDGDGIEIFKKIIKYTSENAIKRVEFKNQPMSFFDSELQLYESLVIGKQNLNKLNQLDIINQTDLYKTLIQLIIHPNEDLSEIALELSSKLLKSVGTLHNQEKDETLCKLFIENGLISTISTFLSHINEYGDFKNRCVEYIINILDGTL